MSDRIADIAEPIIACVADALIFADNAGVIRVWNAAAEGVFGFTADEAIGQSLDLIIPDRLRHAHWTAFDRAIESGVTALGGRATITRGVHKTGKRLYVDMSFAIVRSSAGATLGAVAMARDVTARQDAEKARQS